MSENSTKASQHDKSPSAQNDAPSTEQQTEDKPLGGKNIHLPNTGTEVYLNTAHVGTDSTAMVILLTNSLGIKSTNNLHLADQFAAKLGCTVAMPDIFEGDPVPTGGAILDDEVNMAQSPVSTEQTAAPSSVSMLVHIKSFAVSAVKGFLEDMWAARHSLSHTLPLIESAVQELLDVYKPSQVVVVGYSFGAKYVLHLLSSSNSSSKSTSSFDAIKCGVAVHPSLLEASDSKDVTKPLHLVYAKDDDLLPEPLVRKALQVLADRTLDSESTYHAEVETTVYDNETERAVDSTILPLPHGFAVPGDYPASIVGDRPEKVFRVITAWISEHL